MNGWLRPRALRPRSGVAQRFSQRHLQRCVLPRAGWPGPTPVKPSFAQRSPRWLPTVWRRGDAIFSAASPPGGCGLPRQPAIRPSPAPCPTFDAWTRNGRLRSVSIVLANGFSRETRRPITGTPFSSSISSPIPRSNLQDLTLNCGRSDTPGDDPATSSKGCSWRLRQGLQQDRLILPREQLRREKRTARPVGNTGGPCRAGGSISSLPIRGKCSTNAIATTSSGRTAFRMTEIVQGSGWS